MIIHRHKWVLKNWWQNTDDNYCGADSYICIRCNKIKQV